MNINENVLDGKTLLSPEELSARWGISVRSLANKRAAGTQPGYFKLGRKVWYDLEEIQKIEVQSYKKPNS
tara:strand:- start:644 stop:853 length:210 start_codon:yes stop_codon:yes gene_type:complete